MKHQGNWVDVEVGAFTHDWVMATEGTDRITIGKATNMWAILKQHLQVRPNDYQEVKDRSEVISFQLLDTSSTAVYSRASSRTVHMNTLYRCYIDPAGQAAIRRYLDNQFKHAFHLYMIGCQNADVKIMESITGFLCDYNLPIDSKVIARLTKDWYRYRQKNPDKFHIPIFF